MGPKTIDTAELRRRAIEQLHNQTPPADAPQPDAMQRLLEELKVHQIELELQNEELQRAYAEMEISQNRYFELYDLAPVGYATVSKEGLILEANLTLATMLGVVRGKLARRPLTHFIVKGDHNLYHRHRYQLLTTGEPQACELRMVKSDGTTCWIDLVMSITQQPVDPEYRMVFNDVTERKRAERLSEENIELERKVELRSRELLEVERKYLHAEKLAAIGRLSASIAHEFNNPLQSILTILKGINQYSDLNEKEMEFVSLAIQECRRMGNLITSLQDFYRPSTGKYESVDLHAVVDSILVLAKKDFHTRKISVVKEYAADLPAINAVTDQLKQVFLNLFNNAADACEGGGVITITSEIADREYIAVHIKDSGAGIDPAHINRIFDPFFTTKQQHKGTGLGLSVSYGIVKDHGGEIKVKSEPGEGTMFSIFLPINGAGARNNS